MSAKGPPSKGLAEPKGAGFIVRPASLSALEAQKAEGEMASHTVPVLPMPGAEPVRNTMKFAGADTYSGMNSAMTVAADRDRGESSRRCTATRTRTRTRRATWARACAAPRPSWARSRPRRSGRRFPTGERQQHHGASGTVDVDGDGNVDTPFEEHLGRRARLLRVAHTHVNTEKGDRLRRLQRKPLAGRQRLDGRLDLADASRRAARAQRRCSTRPRARSRVPAAEEAR